MHFYYKISSETELGSRLATFIDLVKTTNKLAEEYRDRYNADGYMEQYMGFAGGVSALIFNKHAAPEHWELVRGTKDVFIPDNEELFKEMLAVPCVPIMAFLALLPPMRQLRTIKATPTLFQYEGFWYVGTTYEVHSRITDAATCTEQEYKKQEKFYIKGLNNK